MEAVAIDSAGAANATKRAGASLAAWWMLALLALLYVLSFVDRVILALLVTPIKAELNVSDVQIGLLFGVAFAVFYAGLGLPAARLADRGDRRWLIVVGAVIWSLSTVASGFAPGFAALVALRIGLACGEAALTPAAHSLIGDAFPPRQRVLAASIYTAAGMGAAAGAYLLGAMVIDWVAHAEAASTTLPFASWRIVFFIVGAPALVLALVFLVSVREPKRLVSASKEGARVGEVGAYFWKQRGLFFPLFVAVGLSQATGYAVLAWTPEMLLREHGWSIPHAGFALGATGLVAGLLGPILAPLATQWLASRGLKDALAVVSMVCVLASAVCGAAAMVQTSGDMIIALLGLSLFFIIGSGNNVVVGMQVLAPAPMRATFVAILLLCITLLGMGVGPVATAWVKDSGLLGADALLSTSLAVIFVVISLPSLVLFQLSRTSLRTPNQVQPPKD